MRVSSIALLGVTLWFGCFASAHAQFGLPEPDGMPFDSYFSDLAREIGLFLDSEKAKDRSIAVAFTGPPTWKASGSNRLVEELKNALRRQNIKTESPAKFAFKGEYKLSKAGKLHIQGGLIDHLGEVPSNWSPFPPCAEPDPQIIATIMGLSVDLVPRPGLKHEESVRRSFIAPTIAITGQQSITARAAATSPFGVRVLVNKEPKRLTTKAGLAFVDLDLDDTFELEILNDSAHEVASAVAVDGLSIFHFSELREPRPPRLAKEIPWEGGPRYKYYIFGSKTSGLVQGWEKDAKTVRAFKIVPFEECAAVQSGQTTDVGMITVSFHASWEKDKSTPPRDEDRKEVAMTGKPFYTRIPITKPDGTKGVTWRGEYPLTSTTKVGAGFGQDILVNSQGVAREIGAARGLVTIRYARKDGAQPK